MERKINKTKKVSQDSFMNREVSEPVSFVETDVEESIIVSSSRSDSSDSYNDAEVESSKTKNPFLKPLIIIVLIVVVFGVGLTFIFSDKSDKAKEIISPVNSDQAATPGSVTINSVQVLAQLSKIYSLPEKESPMVIPVTNKMLFDLKNDAFFSKLLANAKEGNWLINYSDRSILYDFLANKIIMIGFVKNATLPKK